MDNKSYFKKIEARPDFPELEKQVGAKWKQNKTFERSIEQSRAKPEFILYDGPPFATGSPHYGTIFVSALKDLVARYKTMRGYYVPRNWGGIVTDYQLRQSQRRILGFVIKVR